MRHIKYQFQLIPKYQYQVQFQVITVKIIMYTAYSRSYENPNGILFVNRRVL